MSSGTQVDMDWAGTDAGQGEAAALPGSARNAGAAGTAQMTDEEILGLEPIGVVARARTEDSRPGEARNLSSIDDDGRDAAQRDSSGKDEPRFAENAHRKQNDNVQEKMAGQGVGARMPEWMRTLAADPKHGAEAQQLWREHQEFRAAFSSPEEASAIKELLPGGVKDVLSLREATQSVDRIDAALFSGDARAQSDVVAELARTNPAAFRSMFAEAARVLAGMGEVGARQEAGKEETGNFANAHGNPATSHDSQITNHPSQELRASQSRVTNHETPQFDRAAYASFERATNDEVARDVRGSISETLGRVMPEGVAEGASRRMGEDIFNEVHRALAADRELSEQVASVLRDRRFGGAEQQKVAALLAGRAKQLVPSVARRVIGEWTSTVLNTARSKAARQAAAASRVDIAAAGGSLDSMPLRAMSAREVNYASMSDEQILGM